MRQRKRRGEGRRRNRSGWRIFSQVKAFLRTFGSIFHKSHIAGNPLLKEKYSDTGKTDMKIKKRWDDDVVFKNCSRAEPDAKETNFINDSLRNEFHKRFMDKYIK